MMYFNAAVTCMFAFLLLGCAPSEKVVQEAMTQTQEVVASSLAQTQESWTPTPHKIEITYKVIGTVSQAQIGYGDKWVMSTSGNEGFTQENLPWQTTITYVPGTTLSIAAIRNENVDGSLECQIWVDGELKTNSKTDPSSNFCMAVAFLP
jgi:hypothetical protein